MTTAKQINREQLLTDLQSVATAVTRADQTEQSTCVVWDVDRFITYNGTIGCTAQHHHAIDDSPIAIPYAPLVNLLSKLTEDAVEVSATDSELIIKGKRRRAGIRIEREILMPLESIPKAPKMWKIPSELLEGLELVLHCVAKSTEEFAMQCVRIDQEYVEGASFEQLARYYIGKHDFDPMLIDRDSAKAIVQLNPTRWGIEQGWLCVSNKTQTLHCRTYADEWFDLDEQLTFDENECHAVTMHVSMLEAVERAKLLMLDTEEETISVDIVPGKIRIKGRGPTGWYEEMRKTEYDGERLSFDISPALFERVIRYYQDCLLTHDRLIVDTDAFVYVTSLADTKGE